MATKPLKSLKFPTLDDTYTVPQVDDTLAVQGAAADAKKVGDELTDIKGDLSQLISAEISPNLFNPRTVTAGQQLANAGYTMSNADYSVSDYIDISGLEHLYIGCHVAIGTQTLRICYYDSSKTNISDTTQGKGFGSGGTYANDTITALTVPQNAKYCRFHFYTSTVSNLFLGDYADPETYVYVPYGSETIISPSTETIDARGTFQTLGDRLDNIDTRIPADITLLEYWGDSLTQGNQDSTGVSRISVMRTLLGNSWTVKNYGVGGEKSNAISARASGIFAIISAGVTIPADGSAVDLTDKLTDIYGNTIAFGNGIYSDGYNGWVTVNPCYVNGVECVLQRTNSTSPITIKRKTSGEAVNITRPAYIVMSSRTFVKNPVLLICAGQNEGFNRDADELISQIDGIIESRKSDRYIVFGLPHALYGYTWETEINAKLENKYGKKYYDIEKYMKTPVYDTDGTTIVSSYALQDANITPTASDLTAIAQNQYPPSIMFDGVHFNQYGYTVWANREYTIGKYLGYWL